MMDIDNSAIIEDFFLSFHDIFTIDEFCHMMKSQGVKLSHDTAQSILDTSDMVFSLVDEEYITRAGVFIGRWFSFMPSAEEI